MNKIEITAKDGNRYNYTTAFVNAENPLGIVKATLQEYSIFKADDPETFIGKLYKTKEGNWYDLPANASINPLLRTMIKMAIDEIEKESTFSENEGKEHVL